MLSLHCLPACLHMTRQQLDGCTSAVSGAGQTYLPHLAAAGEDDGWLMLFLFHEADQHSELVVYDAKTMRSEPLATVRMPQRVPYGFHSHFISEDRLKALVKVAAMESATAKQRASSTA